jgi:hypothetical protein
MTYVLRERVNNRYYCKDHNKIIEFDDPQTAHNFLATFGQYAMMMAMSMIKQDPGIILEVQQILNATTIDEKPDCNTVEFITYNDILKSKGF